MWLAITAAFVGTWIFLGFFLFQVVRYAVVKHSADREGKGWDEGL